MKAILNRIRATIIVVSIFSLALGACQNFGVNGIHRDQTQGAISMDGSLVY
jgi:hypothetical protein